MKDFCRLLWQKKRQNHVSHLALFQIANISAYLLVRFTVVFLILSLLFLNELKALLIFTVLPCEDRFNSITNGPVDPLASCFTSFNFQSSNADQGRSSILLGPRRKENLGRVKESSHVCHATVIWRHRTTRNS